MNDNTPPHIPEGYIASLSDFERSEFRKMFASTSEADREEIRDGDPEDWEAFSEIYWQLVAYDEAEEERALSKRDQIALHVRRRCRPLSAIFEADEEYKRQSVLSIVPNMVRLNERSSPSSSPAASPVETQGEPASSFATPAFARGPDPAPLGSHPPEDDSRSIPSIPVSNDEDFGTDPVSFAKKAQSRLNRFMARAKSHVKRGKR